MKSKEKLYLVWKIALISFTPTFLIWLPFIFGLKSFFFLKIDQPGFSNILKNWDGPGYVMVAKTFYNTNEIGKLLFSSLPHEYFFTHLPLYPLLMRIISIFFDLFKSGVIINLLFGFLLNLLFYQFSMKYTNKPLLLTFIFTVFPARFLILRSIIAPETLMLFLILLSFYFWDKNNYFLTGVTGFLAVLTKIHSLILFLAFFLVKRRWWILLIPSAFIFLSLFYYYRVGDFFVFIKAEQINRLEFSFPFSQFNYQAPWVNNHWLEDIVFYFLGMIILTISLYKNKNHSWFYFSFFYTLFLIFIPHRDIGRYSLPLLPFFLIQFEKFFTSKEFKIGLICCLPAIYFYTLNFILINQAPIADWSSFIQ